MSEIEYNTKSRAELAADEIKQILVKHHCEIKVTGFSLNDGRLDPQVQVYALVKVTEDKTVKQTEEPDENKEE